MEVNSMYIPLPGVKEIFEKTRFSAFMYPASLMCAMMKSALQVPYQEGGVIAPLLFSEFPEAGSTVFSSFPFAPLGGDIVDAS